ncbi:MAG: YtxH domain-containing protein [Thermodesulfobacteriota bacterium]
MELTRNLPSAEDILRSIGLQRARGNSDLLSGIAVFGAGMLVGAGLALLFAPSSGAEVREQIGSRIGGMREQLGQKVEQAKRSATGSSATAANAG